MSVELGTRRYGFKIPPQITYFTWTRGLISLKSASPFLKQRQEDHTPETEAETPGGGPAVDASISPLSGWFWWILKFQNHWCTIPNVNRTYKTSSSGEFFVCVAPILITKTANCLHENYSSLLQSSGVSHEKLSKSGDRWISVSSHVKWEGKLALGSAHFTPHTRPSLVYCEIRMALTFWNDWGKNWKKNNIFVMWIFYEIQLSLSLSKLSLKPSHARSFEHPLWWLS